MDRFVVVKRHGAEEAFEEEKLYASVYHPARSSGYSEHEAEELAEHVVEAVTDWLSEHGDSVSSRQIRTKVISLLEDEDVDLADLYRDEVERP